MNTIGERIKFLRKKNNLTQNELSKKIGYTSDTTITKIEKGLIELNQSKLVAFAKALNTSVSFLMGWTDNPEQTNYNISTISDNKTISEDEFIKKYLTKSQQECYKLIKQLNDLECEKLQCFIFGMTGKDLLNLKDIKHD